MRETIIDNLKTRIESYSDLIAAIDADDLGVKLNVPGDKSVAESYAQALITGGADHSSHVWSGSRVTGILEMGLSGADYGVTDLMWLLS